MPLVPTESASRLIPPNIRNTPPPPKSSHRLHRPEYRKILLHRGLPTARFGRLSRRFRPVPKHRSSACRLYRLQIFRDRRQPGRRTQRTAPCRIFDRPEPQGPPSHSDPLQTSASRSAAAICHASACDRTPMHHPPFRSYLSPQPFRPSADSVQYPPAKHC